MRLRLKKTLTWSVSVFAFVLLTFNYFNRHVWLATGRSRHLDRNADDVLEYGRVVMDKRNSGPVLRRLTTEHSARNVTLERPLGKRVTQSPNFDLQTVLSDKQVLWPSRGFYENDRIVNQLHFKPKWLTDKQAAGEEVKLKKILLYTGLGGWAVKRGQQTFMEQKCAVNTCELIDNRDAKDADAVVFSHSPQKPWLKRPANQVWILFLLESPYHTSGLGAYGSVYNWTATYRHDSDIVAPYEKFIYFDENVRTLPQNKSYAAGKTKKVAWFVSNCGARNTRKEYAIELSKYIDVDIYGACGKLRCPRKDSKCFDMLNTDYKFYLSFENSNCRDYITEKFFVTGLQHDVIPIVMGGAPEDYARAAPPHSYIHVDEFESPEELAKYLHKLDTNDDLYNEYFKWKGTGTFINTYFWCRVCAMLHETSRGSHTYHDLEKWWRGENVCIGKQTWRQHKPTSRYINEDYLTD